MQLINLQSSKLPCPQRGHWLVNLCHCVRYQLVLYPITGFVGQKNLPLIYYVIKWV